MLAFAFQRDIYALMYLAVALIAVATKFCHRFYPFRYLGVYTHCISGLLSDPIHNSYSGQTEMKFTFESHSEIYYMLKALNETHSAIEKGQVGMINDESRKRFDSLRFKFQEFALANL